MGKENPTSMFWLDFADRLYNILRKETKAYRKLFLSAQKRHAALLKRDMELLEVLNQEDGTIVEGIKRYERDRAHLLKYSFSRSWPGYDGLSLRELIERMPPELANHKEDLKDLRGEFSKVIESLKDINDLNGSLIARALDYIDFSIKLYVNSADKDTTYQDAAVKKNEVKSTSMPSILDRRG